MTQQHEPGASLTLVRRLLRALLFLFLPHGAQLNLIAVPNVLAQTIPEEPGAAGTENEPVRNDQSAEDDFTAVAETAHRDPTLTRESVQPEIEDDARSLDRVLSRSASVLIQRRGAYGAASTVRIGGADANQTDVFVGGIPLLLPSGLELDLSWIPSWMVSEVHVYRGNAPVELNSGAIGGAINLIPRLSRSTGFRSSLTGGSLGFFEGRLESALVGRDYRLTTAVAATVSDGTFSYRDDNRTPFNVADDRVRQRQNGQVTDGVLFHHGRLAISQSTEARFILLLSERVGAAQSHPAREADPPLARRGQSVAFAAIQLRHRLSPTDVLDGAIGAGLFRLNVDDPLGQFGLLPGQSQISGERAHLEIGSTHRLWRQQGSHGAEFELGTRARFGLEEGRTESTTNWSFQRETGALAIEPRLRGRAGDGHFEFRLLARAEAAHNSHSEGERGGNIQPTTRLSGNVNFGFLTLRSSVAYNTRIPSALELGGNGTLLNGNPLLRPETAISLDAAILLESRVGSSSGSVEFRFVQNNVSNLIRYRSNSQFTLVPENIARAETNGLVAIASLGIEGYVTIAGHFSYLDSRDVDLERQLPFRTPIRTLWELTLRSHSDPQSEWNIEALLGGEYLASSFYDPDNLIRVPARGYAHATLRFRYQRLLRVWLSAIDLFDQRGYDVVGYPLPGRQVDLGASVDF